MDGDAAGTGNVSEENAEALTTEEAAEQKTAQMEAPAQNYHFDELDLPRGPKKRFEANVAAIETVRRIIAENRTATPEEQEILSKFVGWGALAEAFDPANKDWAKEYKRLKALLSEDEWNRAASSTQNAHYTDISVVKAMYKVLQGWGFRGGRMLEPSAGSGNFLGAMPADMARTVISWRAVELDPITGEICKALYPQARVEIKGFEDARIPDDSIDVAIGNPPFGKTAPFDKRYEKVRGLNLHNYFFAKAIDKVRPGGLVFFVTSSFTMDSWDDNFRKYMSQRADFRGAVRLPSNAFTENAGTQVVTDILVFQKRGLGARDASEPYFETAQVFAKERYVRVNRYYADHPEMILGTLSPNGEMYRRNTDANGNEIPQMTVESNGKPIGPQIEEALGKLDITIPYERAVRPEVAQEAAIRASRQTKENGYELKDGKVYVNKDGELQEVELKKEDADKLAGLLELRDLGRGLVEAQKMGIADIAPQQKLLNKAYDAFVRKYGYIHKPQNLNAIKGDPDREFIAALESWDADRKTGKKADIFTKRVYERVARPERAETVSEAVMISENETGGKMDLARVAELMNLSQGEARERLLEERQAFLDEDGNLISRGEYLSGYVRTKLDAARTLAEEDERYKANVEELEKIVPKDKTKDQIAVHMGESWIPTELYDQFVNEQLQNRYSWNKKLTCFRDQTTGKWQLNLTGSKLDESTRRRNRALGAADVPFTDIFEANMNGKTLILKVPGTDSKVVDTKRTAVVQERQNKLREEFKEWLFGQEDRAEAVLKVYNDSFRNYVNRQFDGAGFTVNGMNPDPTVQMRDYQAQAAQRIVQSGGNTLLAHCVGAGKTFTMAAAAMKLKELGLVKKPMFVVPKALSAQWGREFRKFFPAARILLATEKDFQPAGRREFISRIATNDFDAVIVSGEKFTKIEMSEESQREFLEEQLDQLRESLRMARAAQGRKGRSVKEIEKAVTAAEAKLKKISSAARDEGNTSFEDLGVDGIFVDEVHNYKNLYYTTSMQVSGLGNTKGAKKSADLLMKIRYLQKLNGGRGIVFATATPIMNSMVEMYTMQRYLQPEALKRYGIEQFDAWAAQFGQVTSEVMPKPGGSGFRVEKIFSRFQNMAELQRMFRACTDVITKLPDSVKLPKVRGGKHTIVECDASDYQKEYISWLGARADALSGNKLGLESTEWKYNFKMPERDNMLLVCSDGRKVALSQRLVDNSLDWGMDSKVYRCADLVAQEYEQDKENLGTQLIFCDLSVPHGQQETTEETSQEESGEAVDAQSGDVYNEIKRALVARGIKSKEIAFIHEFNSTEKKEQLSKLMNDGKIRVLIGSTSMMGVGLNVQKRVTAMHHLDCPWRPGDLEQRDGRGIRYGNIHEDVAIYNYVTVGTFDTRMWAKIEQKSHFISQVMNGNEEMDDIAGDEMGMSAAEIKAAASGNPLILEQVAVDRDIQRLEALKAGVEQEQKELRRKAETQREVVSVLERYLPMLNKDAKKAEAKDVSGDNFTATVDGKTYNDRKEAGTAILKLVNKNYVKSATDYKVNAFEERGARGNRLFKLGTMAGFDIVCDTHMNVGLEGDLVWMAKVTETPDGTMRSIAGKLKTMSDYAKSVPEQIRRATAEAETLEKKAENAFDQQKELDRLRRRQYEIEQILNPEGQTNFAEAQADTEEQSVEASERRETKSDRRILAEALESVAVNDAERDALARYKNNVERIDRLSDQLKEVNAEIKEKSFAKGKRDTARLAELNAKKQALENTISREDKTLLRLERSENLRRVLEVERKKVRAEERAAAQERLQRYRERSEMELEEVKQRARERYAKRVEVDAVTKLKADIAQRVNHMRKLLLQPTDKAYIPELAQGSIARLLDAIDFTSRRALRGGDPTRADMRLAQSMEAVRSLFQSTYDAQNMTSEEAVNDAFGAYIDLPQGFIQDMAAMTEAIRRETDKAIGDGGFTVNQMNSEQLENLKHILDTMFHALRTMNKTMADGFYDNVVQMASDGIWDAKQKGQIVKDSGARRWLEYEHTTPVYFFKRIGRAGISLFTGFKNGVKKLADHTEEIKEFVEQHVTEDEVRSWRKEIHEFKLNNGDTVRLPADYIMNMYNHSKREQAMGHYLGAGFRRLDITSAGTEQVDDGHNMDMADFQRIIDTLNERQRKVADDFRVFVGETGGEWGNEVSMRRFGARQYTEGANYWPIKVDTDYTNSDPSADTPQNADLYRLLNMGFTKRLVPKANNRILVGSMFDTFADHMAEMAQYNAFALPVLDAVKFLNYRETTQGRNGQRLVNSIKSVMRVAYGKGAVGYFTQFIKDVSGAGVTGQNEKIVGKLLRMRNRGAVAANLRVAALQPTAIARALNVMGARDLGLGTLKGLTPAKLRQNADEMEAASGIARWKKLGFYDANVGRSMREMFGTERTRAGSVLDKTLEKSMKLAETADRYTWSIIWEAAKQKALRANPALKNDNDALITAATEIFDDTIYKTQVVDSVLTRSQYMRNNEGWHKFFSSFMMEPVLTYNVLLDGIVETEEDARTLGSRKAAYEKHKGKLARAFAVYTVTATLAAMVEAVFEALRDDDDYETFGTKFRDAFAGNFLDDIVPFTKLPVISELWNGTKSILEAVGMNVYGYGSSNPISEIMDVAVKFIQVFRKRLASDNGYTWYGVLYNAAKIPQTVGGIPIANLMREGVALWNNTAAAWLGQRRIETYRTSDSVGAEEFVKAYMREERTRMDALLHAMSANGADVPGAITAAAKRYFQAGRLSEDDAADLLVLHGKATTRNEALLTVRKWETQARTGNSSAGDYARVYDLIENWDGAGLRTEIRELTNLGKKPKDIASGITGKFKPIYLAASAADKTRLKQHLIEAYKLLGYDMDAAMKKIAAWEDD